MQGFTMQGFTIDYFGYVIMFVLALIFFTLAVFVLSLLLRAFGGALRGRPRVFGLTWALPHAHVDDHLIYIYYTCY